MMTCNGLRQPAFIGISSSTSVRNTYRTAALHTAEGALKLVGCCGLVSLKSMVASRFALSIDMVTTTFAPLSISYSKCPSFSTSSTRRTASSALSCTCFM